LSPTDGFSRAQLLETFNEIVGQISTILPEAFFAALIRWKRAAGPPFRSFYGHQTSAVIAAVQGFEAKAASSGEQSTRSAIHKEYLSYYSWHNAWRTTACVPQLRTSGDRWSIDRRLTTTRTQATFLPGGYDLLLAPPVGVR
jgi:hypothetical protein